MYNNDYLGDEVVPEYDEEMSVTVDDLSTLDSEIIEERRILKAYKKADSGYYSFRKNVNGESVKIEVYSVLNDGRIRHAITGLKTPYPIGCKQDNLFFTIVDSSMLTSRTNTIGRRKLYYNSPEEYERHFYTTISQPIKQKWLERRNATRRQLDR